MTRQTSLLASRFNLRVVVFLCAFASMLPSAAAQMKRSAPASAPPSTTIPALFLSDIHLDPYGDPAKVHKLNAAPASEWQAILAAPDAATKKQDAAALQAKCPVRGVDTPNVLWQSSLRAIRADAAKVRFVTISGDLLAHSFDCKYKALVPAGTHADYVAFTEKTIRYVVGGLRTSLPGVPIYVSMGNNDSGCMDYALAADHDEFLALTAKVVAEALPEGDREAVLRDFAAGGYYNVALPSPMENTRLIVLDDLFLSGHYVTCGNQHDAAPAAAQIAWLNAQLAAAREAHQTVWVLGHIPPGVDLYSTARKFTNVCAGGKPVMFLGSEALAESLAAYGDVVRLALFGHTHSDEMRLLTAPGGGGGVPVKITASITPVNGNRPSFTVAAIDPVTATLVDYTVMMASNLTGVGTTWSKEYSYAAAYHEKAFSAEALGQLISDFRADPEAAKPESAAYLRNYFPGDASALIKFVWPQYACSMDHDSAESFAACSCAVAK